MLNIIDKQNCIKYRLYRNHTVFLAETKTILKVKRISGAINTDDCLGSLKIGTGLKPNYNHR